MKKLLLLFLLSNSFLFGQRLEEFKYTKDSIITSVVVPMEGMSAEDIYNKSLNWIKTVYKNPEKVIESKVDNDFIRFNGYKENGFCAKILLSTSCYNTKYNMTIYVKDNKYKFEINDVILINEGAMIGKNYQPRTEQSLNFTDNSYMFSKDGKIKDRFKYFSINYYELFNKLNLSLFDYISGITKKTSDSW